jgi:hypothetical protein
MTGRRRHRSGHEPAVGTIDPQANDQSVATRSWTVPGKDRRLAPPWVSQASAAAAEVLAWERPLEEILQEAQEHWTLQKPAG